MRSSRDGVMLLITPSVWGQTRAAIITALFLAVPRTQSALGPKGRSSGRVLVNCITSGKRVRPEEPDEDNQLETWTLRGQPTTTLFFVHQFTPAPPV